jgi:hypothetical protein
VITPMHTRQQNYYCFCRVEANPLGDHNNLQKCPVTHVFVLYCE